jgi:hypothetical protein
MGGSYTADEQAAAKLAGLIADGPTKLTAGTASSTGTETTDAIVAHGLGSTPDWVIGQRDKADVIGLSWSANTTNITFVGTTETTWTVSYIAGYSA